MTNYKRLLWLEIQRAGSIQSREDAKVKDITPAVIAADLRPVTE